MAITLEDLAGKLDRLTALVLGLPTTAHSPEPGVVPAYDRPELTASEVVADGKTVNGDGSIWTVSDSDFSPTPDHVEVRKGEPFRLVYGYISPVKTPTIWEAGARMSGNWPVVDAMWKANPYALYKADIPSYLRTLGPSENQFITLGYLLQPFSSFVQ